MQIVFRADASVTIGTGHVMRCLALAHELEKRGSICRFVTRDLPGHLAVLIKSCGFEVSLLPAPSGPVSCSPPVHAYMSGVTWERDLMETRAALDATDWLIVDHYAFDERWERGLVDFVGNIMVIDDLADRPHVAALLLDQNFGRKASDYDDLVPDSCNRLIGPSFALLRPEFASRREAALAKRKIAQQSHLMISMGGTDAVDATSMVLRALKRANLPQKLQISVVMGSRAPALASVRSLASSMPWPTEVLVDSQDMAALMLDADLAVGSGGGTTWERCCLGLPFVSIVTAFNQYEVQRALVDAGIVPSFGRLDDPSFEQWLHSALTETIAKSQELSEGASRLCDGLGASRIADILGARMLTTRRADLTDAVAVWNWRNAGSASKYYLNAETTPLDAHLSWFERALKSDTRDLLIIESDGIPAGHVRFDRDSVAATAADVSICTNPIFRGKGLGASLLIAGCEWAMSKGISLIFARVHQDNIASKRIFDRAGFSVSEQEGDFNSLVLESFSIGSEVGSYNRGLT